MGGESCFHDYLASILHPIEKQNASLKSLFNSYCLDHAQTVITGVAGEEALVSSERFLVADTTEMW